MKDNKLLAEYLGWRKTPKQSLWYADTSDGSELMAEGDKDLKFDYSWDWLMLVVDKIEEEWKIKVPFMLYIFENLNPDSKYKYGAGFTDLHCEKFGDTKIEAVYNACVEYIKTKS